MYSVGSYALQELQSNIKQAKQYLSFGGYSRTSFRFNFKLSDLKNNEVICLIKEFSQLAETSSCGNTVFLELDDQSSTYEVLQAIQIIDVLNIKDTHPSNTGLSIDIREQQAEKFRLERIFAVINAISFSKRGKISISLSEFAKIPTSQVVESFSSLSANKLRGVTFTINEWENIEQFNKQEIAKIAGSLKSAGCVQFDLSSNNLEKCSASFFQSAQMAFLPSSVRFFSEFSLGPIDAKSSQIAQRVEYCNRLTPAERLIFARSYYQDLYNRRYEALGFENEKTKLGLYELPIDSKDKINIFNHVVNNTPSENSDGQGAFALIAYMGFSSEQIRDLIDENIDILSLSYLVFYSAKLTSFFQDKTIQLDYFVRFLEKTEDNEELWDKFACITHRDYQFDRLLGPCGQLVSCWKQMEESEELEQDSPYAYRSPGFTSIKGEEACIKAVSIVLPELEKRSQAFSGVHSIVTSIFQLISQAKSRGAEVGPLYNMAIWGTVCSLSLLNKPELLDSLDYFTEQDKEVQKHKQQYFSIVKQALEDLTHLASPTLRFALTRYLLDGICSNNRETFFKLVGSNPTRRTLTPAIAVWMLLSSNEASTEWLSKAKSIINYVSKNSLYEGKSLRTFLSAVLSMAKDKALSPDEKIGILLSVFEKPDERKQFEGFVSEFVSVCESKPAAKLDVIKRAQTSGVSEGLTRELVQLAKTLPDKEKLAKPEIMALRRRVQRHVMPTVHTYFRRQAFASQMSYLVSFEGFCGLGQLSVLVGLRANEVLATIRKMFGGLFEIPESQLAFYETTLAGMRNEGALLTYYSKVKSIAVDDEGIKLLELLSLFVRQVLSKDSEDFYHHR